MLQYFHLRGFKLPRPRNDNPVPAESFSADEQYVLRRMARGEFVTQENSGLSQDEWLSLMTRLGRATGADQSANA